MSPEILLGNEFDLPTDIFSLGVIFAEVASRKLADDSTFKRTAPMFAVDESEVRELANAGCPKDFVQLAVDCLAQEPSKRPMTREVLERLRACEAEVLAKDSELDDVHTGSIKFMSGTKRPNTAPRIPSFGMGVGKDIGNVHYFDSDDDSDEELKKAVAGLSQVTVPGGLSSSIMGRYLTHVYEVHLAHAIYYCRRRSWRKPSAPNRQHFKYLFRLQHDRYPCSSATKHIYHSCFILHPYSPS